MQPASDEYIKSMENPYRNRGYIRGTIGIINSEAQRNATIYNGQNSLTYFSDTFKPFADQPVTRVYATAEQDFSKVDGSMYFLPRKESGLNLYNNGFVTNALVGQIYITFDGHTGLDIKGLTIDFGEYYPTVFTIENESVKYNYTNDKRVFVTEDIFDGTSYIIIKAVSMVNGEGRLRINKINFGIVDSFSNVETISYSLNEFVSPTAESLPSKDVEIILDNQDSYYNPDNPNSALSYLELGQEVRVTFGYDVMGNGIIEWLPETLTYLKGWSANDIQVQFICTDLFDSMEGTYYKGIYREQGISLYDLAVDVLTDAGFESEQYYLDPYLKDVVVQNPMPAVKHSEALQIIANAGRCALYDDRDGRIHLQASFVPDMEVESNGETEYSHIENVLEDKTKDAYAVASNNFTTVDGSVFFMPKGQNYLYTGYVSESMWIGTEVGTMSRRLGFRLGTDEKYLDEDNGYWTGDMPEITIHLSAGFVSYGFKIDFRNVKPGEFVINTYYEEVSVETITIHPTSPTYETHRRFEMFDKMVIQFTKGYPDSRIFVDYIGIGNVTNYTISKIHDLKSNPTAIRMEKLRDMKIVRSIYSQPQVEDIELVSEDVNVSTINTTHIVYFREPSYHLSAKIENNENIKATIVDSSNYFAKVQFSGVTTEMTVRLIINGKEYTVDENPYTKNYNQRGTDVVWGNPLVSAIQHAMDLEEWLSSYYLGELEYQFDWRGDPRVDANDLFYLELKDGRKTTIRAYENSLSFNGAWSGNIKSRAVVI